MMAHRFGLLAMMAINVSLLFLIQNHIDVGAAYFIGNVTGAVIGLACYLVQEKEDGA